MTNPSLTCLPSGAGVAGGFVFVSQYMDRNRQRATGRR